MNIVYTDKITAEAYNALLKSVGWKERPHEQILRGLKNSIVFAAEHDGIPVGIARIVTDGGYIAIIVDVIVRPDYQGNGIGKALTQKAVDYLKNNLPAGWGINISLMSAKGREKFYEQFGFISRPNGRYGDGMSLFHEKKVDEQ